MEDLQQPVDLLLTDVIMEGMSGGELAGIFSDRYPETPVLFVSGYPEDELTRHGVQQASMEFLAKPYSPGELLARISQILQSYTVET
jgi:DNA-binding response OmpR family regulator